MLDFSSLGIALNVVLFGASAALLWLAATRLALYAAEIADRFNVGEAAVGVLLLAGVTSLPEIGTSFAAATSGDGSLAVNNLLGSIALQVVMLALADALFDKRALTSVVPNPVVMLQGGVNVILLTGVAMAVTYTDVLVLGAGLWTWGLAFGAAYGLRKVARSADREPWVAQGVEEKQPERTALEGSNAVLLTKTVASGAVILAAGVVAARAAEALADQTGLGASFMGMVFLALATSLPELSTVIAAMRRGLYTMAISDILGTNIFNIALLFGIDLIASGEPVLTRVGAFSAVGALLGVVVTALFLLGLIERRDRTILTMGLDSAAVLVVYGGGLVMLYTLR